MMGEGKEERKRDTLLYYIGEIYRGEGKGYLPKKGEGEVFREEKGCFGEENRGRNWDWERDKLKNRWELTGVGREIKRGLNGN